MAKNRASLLALLLILAVSATVVVSKTLRAQETTAKVPPVVITASNGAVVGTFLNVDGSGRPNVLFQDTTMGGRPFVMVVADNGMRPFEFQIFYSGAGCTGTAYVNVPQNRFGFNKMTGILYAVGPGTGGDIYVYRSDSSGPGAMVSYLSVYSSPNPDFDTVACDNGNTGSATLVTASAVINLSTDFPNPYTASF